MTIDEAREAYKKGLRRSEAARRRGGKHRHGWAPTPEKQRFIDGMSAVSEFLVSNITGRKWLSDGLVPDRPEDGDVEGGIMVRWTELTNGSLIMHPDDLDHLRCVLVVGSDPMRFRVVGYMYASDAKLPQYWRTNVREAAFFIPQGAPQWRAIEDLILKPLDPIEDRPLTADDIPW